MKRRKEYFGIAAILALVAFALLVEDTELYTSKLFDPIHSLLPGLTPEDFNVDGNELRFLNKQKSVNLSITAKVNGSIYDVSNYIKWWKEWRGDHWKFGANISIPDTVKGQKIANNLEEIIFEVNSTVNLKGLKRGLKNGFEYLETCRTLGVIETCNYVSFDFFDILDSYDNIPLTKSVDSFITGNETVNSTIYTFTLVFNVSNKTFSRGQVIELDPTVTIDNVSEYDSTTTNVTNEDYPMSHITLDGTELFAYYPMDLENKSTTIYDYSPYNHDGTLTGNDIHYTSSGYIGGAWSFGGNADYINLGDLNIDHWTNLTACIWINTSMEDLASPFSGFSGSSLRSFRIYKTQSSDAAGFYVINQTGSADAYILGTTEIHDGEWHHICGVFSGVNPLKLYVDGASEGSITGTEPENIGYPTTGVVAIGCRDGAAECFEGQIDEVMLWNRSLDGGEISEIYNNQSARFKTPANQSFKPSNITDGNNSVNMTVSIQNYMDTNISMRVGYYNYTTNLSGLILYMPFDWDSSDAKDISGEGNDGAFTNAVSINDSGYLGKAAQFEGSNEYIDISANNYDFNESGFTYALWLYAASLPTDNYENDFVFRDYGDGDNDISLRIGRMDSNIWRLMFWTHIGDTDDLISSSPTVSNPPYNNRWAFVVVSWNGTHQNLYINGTLLASDTTSNRNFTMDMGVYWIGANSNVFDGLVDEYMAFDRALTTSEVSDLYTETYNNRIKQYSAYQNMTNGTETQFTIDVEADFIFPEAQFHPDNYNFYSPVLYNSITMETWNDTVAAPPADANPVVTLETPDDASLDTDGFVFFNCTATDDNDVTNISMYSNASGTWALNYTNSTSGTWAQSTNNLSIKNATTVLWNCLASDDAGQTDWGDSNRTVTIYISTPDTTKPDLVFADPTLANNSLTNNQSWIYVNVSAGEALDTCLLSWEDNTTNQTMAISGTHCFANITGLTNYTSYYFYVFANDSSSNMNTTEHRNITVNVTNYPPAESEPPDLNFVSPTLANNSQTNNATWIYVNVSADESLDTCLLYWEDNTTNQTMTVVDTFCYANITGLTNNTAYYFYVYGNDSVGNLNTTEHREITINVTNYPDLVAPDLVFTPPTLANNSYTNNESWIYVSINAGEALSSCLLYWQNNNTNMSMSVSGDVCDINITSLTNYTSYYFFVWGNDTSSNMNTSEHRNITVNTSNYPDQDAPGLEFVSPTLANNSLTNNQSWIFVNVSSDEDLGGCLLYWEDNSTNQTMANDTDYCYANITGLTNYTSYYFYVYGNDTFGNLNVTEHRNITINVTDYPPPGDNTPPDLTFVSPTLANESQTNNESYIYINVSSSEYLGGVCLLYWADNSTNQTMANESTYCFANITGLTNNTAYYFYVYGNDSNGNLNTTEHRQITINLTQYPPISDVTPPDIVFVSPSPENETVTENYTYINVSLSETGSACLLDWNGTNETVTGSGTNFYANKTSLDNGNYTFLAWCNDTAGNANQTVMRWVYINYTVDLTAPEVTWIDPTSNGTEALQKNYIEWNISVTEHIGVGYIEINGTNNTCASTNASSSSYCFYNQTGLTANETHCSYGYAADESDNFNRTLQQVCRTIAYSPAPSAPKTVCKVEPLIIMRGYQIEIIWRFHNCI